MSMRNKIIASTMAASLLLLGGAVWAEGEYKTVEVFFERVKVAINGQPSQIDKDSILYNGSVYIPLRSLGEMLGAQVSWEAATRSVHMDFLTDRTDELLQASNHSMFQYLAIRNNTVMNQLKSALTNNDTTAMKNVVQHYEEMRQIAEGLGETEMAASFNKLKAATELLRGGWESKNTDDYLLAWSIYSSNAQEIVKSLRDKIAKQP
jgi:mevalonate kinase